jgi:hypothetical protein
MPWAPRECLSLEFSGSACKRPGRPATVRGLRRFRRGIVRQMLGIDCCKLGLDNDPCNSCLQVRRTSPASRPPPWGCWPRSRRRTGACRTCWPFCSPSLARRPCPSPWPSTTWPPSRTPRPGSSPANGPGTARPGSTGLDDVRQRGRPGRHVALGRGPQPKTVRGPPRPRGAPWRGNGARGAAGGVTGRCQRADPISASTAALM